MPRNTYIIAAYEVDRAFGGHEEGGWWFDTGQLVRVMRMAHNEDAAYALARRANHLLRLVQRNCRDVGCYAAEVYEDSAPAFYHEWRPHYE